MRHLAASLLLFFTALTQILQAQQINPPLIIGPRNGARTGYTTYRGSDNTDAHSVTLEPGPSLSGASTMWIGAGARPMDSFGCFADGGAGDATVSGEKLIWRSGTRFLAVWRDQPILLQGKTYTIASIDSETSLTLASSAGDRPSVEFVVGGPTDNGPCIQGALEWSRDTGGVVSCVNSNTTPAFYGVRTPVIVQLTAAIQWMGAGANSCWVNWSGAPGARTDMIWLWAIIVRNVHERTRIEGIHFSSSSNIEADLKLDQLADFELHHNWFNVTAGDPSYYVLARAAQISHYSDNSWDFGASVASYRGTYLINPQTRAMGCAGGTGDSSDANGCYVTLTTPIGDEKSALTFGVSSTAFTRLNGGNYTLLVDGTFAGGRITGGEALRVSCANNSCTIKTSCSTQGSIRGDKPCRGDEVTVASAHRAGAKVYYGFPIVSEANFSNNMPFWGGDGVHGCAALVDGGEFGFTGNKFAGTEYALCITEGVADLNGNDYFESNQGQAVYQSGGNPYNALKVRTSTNFLNKVQIHGGIIQADGVLFSAGLEIANILLPEISWVRNSVLYGQVSIPKNVDQCGNTSESVSLGRPCNIRGPLVIQPQNARGVYAPGPSLLVNPAAYGDGPNGSHVASVIQLVTSGTAGSTAIQMSNNWFIGGSADNSGVSVCTTLNCASGHLNIRGTALMKAAPGEPDFLPEWEGSSIRIGGSTYTVTKVNAHGSMEVDRAPGNGSDVAYTTVMGRIAAGSPTSTSPGTFSCPAGQHIVQISLDATGQLTGRCN